MRKKAQVLLIVVADACLSRVLRRLPGTPQTQAWSGRGTGPAAGAWHVLPRGSVGITVYESGAEGQRGLLRQGAAADPRWARRLSRRQGGPSMPLKGLWGLDFKGTEAETGSFRTSSVWYQWRPEEGLGATCFVGQGGLPPPHAPSEPLPRLQSSEKPGVPHANARFCQVVPRSQAAGVHGAPGPWEVFGANSGF